MMSPGAIFLKKTVTGVTPLEFAASMEGEDENSDFVDIILSSESLESSAVFHVVNDFIGFILFMHQQIPSVIEEMGQEFNELRAEYADLEVELASGEVKPLSARRKQASRKREVKMRMKRQENFMASVSKLKEAFQLLISEVPEIEKISLVLGSSTLRPSHVYELNFSLGRSVSGNFSRTKLAESLSRKLIRTMISRGTGSNSCPGPTKLLLFVKAPSNLNLPLHFLPKSGLRYNKRTLPDRVRFLCRTGGVDTHTDSCMLSSSKDLIWFQCRHTIKGLSFWTPPPED